MLRVNLIYLYPILKCVFSFISVWKQKVAEIYEMSYESIKFLKFSWNMLKNINMNMQIIVSMMYNFPYILNMKVLTFLNFALTYENLSSYYIWVIVILIVFVGSSLIPRR